MSCRPSASAAVMARSGWGGQCQSPLAASAHNANVVHEVREHTGGEHVNKLFAHKLGTVGCQFTSALLDCL